jgi:hypothetical protein
VDVGSVADVSEVHAPAIFKFEVCRVGEFVYTDKVYLEESTSGEE